MTPAQKERHRVLHNYNLYKYFLRKVAELVGCEIRDERIGFIFWFPLPVKMSKKEKRIKDLTDHKIRPDADNLDKALKDALRVKNKNLPDDSSIYNYSISKYWVDEPKGFIDVYFMKRRWDQDILQYIKLKREKK